MKLIRCDSSKTYMEKEAEQLMMEHMNINFIDCEGEFCGFVWRYAKQSLD